MPKRIDKALEIIRINLIMDEEYISRVFSKIQHNGRNYRNMYKK